jgi:hypothetical protein
MSSDWERDAGSAIALGFAARRNRKVKRRLLEATAGDLAEGEKLRVVSYATRGNAPAIMWWEGGVLVILYVVLFTPLAASFRGILLIGSFCATALWIAHITMSKRWLGVVLTGRRLILFRRAAPPQRLRGVPFDFTAALLDVSCGHVSLQNARQDLFSPTGVAFLVRFDDTVAHGPMKLTFGGLNQADGEAFRDALTGADSSTPDLIQPDPIQPSQDRTGGHARALPARRRALPFVPLALVLLAFAGLWVYRWTSAGSTQADHSPAYLPKGT